MKTLTKLLIVALITTPFFSSKAQNYYPLPNDSVKWIIRAEYPDGGSGSCIWLYDYQITGDTNINLLTYHKLAIVNYSVSGFTCGTIPPYFGAGYVGAIRNDTLLKKVFIFHKDSIQESLLYDFNLTVGDTIKGFLRKFSNIANSYENIAIIDSIDSVLIGGNYRRRWNYTSNCFPTPCFNGFFDGKYIEGMGNVNGLLEGVASEINMRYNLLCFQENGISLYEDLINSNGAGCSITVGTEVRYNRPLINIYPNPFTNSINFEMDDYYEEILVTDLSGKELYHIYESSSKIDLSFLQKGGYIISIKTKNYITIKKIIKL